jgi:hypothetical protein
MAEKQTLAEVLRGRTIQSTQNQNGAMSLGLTDGSTMFIETGHGSSNSAATGGTIRDVLLTETSLHIELVNGKSLTIPLPTNDTTIRVQNKDGALEYGS